MARNGKKRKSEVVTTITVVKKPKVEATPTVPVEDAGLIGDLIFPEELDTTTDTLAMLSKNPHLIKRPELKPFRSAVHNFWRVSNETAQAGNSLTARISSALVDQRHTDALVLLSEMSIRGELPKLGSLQRWVRECDAVLTPSMTREEENAVWQVLDSILRTTKPLPPSINFPDEPKSTLAPDARLRWFEPFTVPPTVPRTHTPVPESVVDEKAAQLSVLQTTSGAERRPPNKYPAIIYFSPPETFPLAPASEREHKPQRYDVPGLSGAFIINDVFERTECETLVRVAEKVGLEPDEPVAGSAVGLASVLAHNLIWLADTAFLDVLYSRIVEHLPQTIHGGAVKGINARFRLYRYRPGALYRPHIDGAWPASALDSTTTPPVYVYDSDPDVYSRLTLLIYLNDDFNGGCTTFFQPSSTPGILEARPVKPRMGTVAVFPHGATEGSLLHEGSGVVGEGEKYVIRTEVLYQVSRKERVDAAKN